LVLPNNHEVEFATRVDPGDLERPEFAELWRMNRTLPRCWIVHDVEAMPELNRPHRISENRERARAVLFPGGKSRDFAGQAEIETVLPAQPPNIASRPGTPRVAADQCQIIFDSPQRILIEAELQQPGLLVLADAYSPGWAVTVTSDGNTREAQI